MEEREEMMDEEIKEETVDVDDTADETEEESSGLGTGLTLILGGALTLGAITGGKWLFKKGKDLLRKRKAAKEAEVELIEGDPDEEDIVDQET